MISNVRFDLGILEGWIDPNSRVLDLGCGDGTLLRFLMDSKQVQGYGLEIDRNSIVKCIEKGVNVVEQDLDLGLGNFSDDSFDTVVITQSIQVLSRPDIILDDMLRVGNECIVTFPNFGSWRSRTSIGLRGRMPVTRQLTYQWYDTPNIHFCTVTDFEALCEEKNINILARRFVAERFLDAKLKDTFPNVFAETAVYHLTK